MQSKNRFTGPPWRRGGPQTPGLSPALKHTLSLALVAAAGAAAAAADGAAQPAAAEPATPPAAAAAPTAAPAGALQLPALRDLNLAVPRPVRAANALLGLGRQRLALVLGLATVGARPVVDNAARDAQAVAAVLRAAGFVVMLREDLLAADLRATLAEFSSRLQPGGMGFVYASGLGAQLDGQNVLLPRDVPLDASLPAAERQAQWRAKAVPLADVVNALMGPAGSPRLLVVDAAYRHPALDEAPAPGLAVQPLPPGLIALFSQAPGALQDVPAAAPLPNPVPADPQEVAASRFARTLVAQLEKPRAKGPEALRATRRALVDGTLGQVQPWLGGDTDDEEVAEATLVDGLVPRTPEEMAREAARQLARTVTRPPVVAGPTAATSAATLAPSATLPTAPATVAATAARAGGEQSVAEVLEQAPKPRPRPTVQPEAGGAANATPALPAEVAPAAAAPGVGSTLGSVASGAASVAGTAASVAGTLATAAAVAKAVETTAAVSAAGAALSTAGSLAGQVATLATRGGAASEPPAAAKAATATAAGAPAATVAPAGTAAATAAAATTTATATPAATTTAATTTATATVATTLAPALPPVAASPALPAAAARGGELSVEAINAAAPVRAAMAPRPLAALPENAAARPAPALRVNAHGYGEGDAYTYQITDTWKNQPKGRSTTAIETVTEDGGLLGKVNGLPLQLDPQGRVLRQANGDGTVSQFEPRQDLWWSNPRRGESRELRFQETLQRGDGRGAGQRSEIEWKGSASVGAPVLVRTAAGDFEALPIASRGWQYARRSDGTRADSQWARTVWYSPRLGHPVAIDIEDSDHLGRLLRRERVELVQAQRARYAP